MLTLRTTLGLATIALGIGILVRKKPARAQLGAGFSSRGLTAHIEENAFGDLTLKTYTVRNLDDRIKNLRVRVEKGIRDPEVYAFARSAVNKKCGAEWCVPEKNDLAELKALYRAIRDKVRYTSDIRGIDSYQNPQRTLEFGTGDCDDYSTLACATAMSIGFPCRFKAIRTKGANDWNHIYSEIGYPKRLPKKWIPFDASIEMGLGWEAPSKMVSEAKTFPV